MVTHKEKHLYQLIEKSAVIIKLIKNWSEKLGQNFTVGAVLSKDLSNIADCETRSSGFHN